MPNIQTELRVQIEGAGTPALVRRTSLQVSSCEQISLFVDGVKVKAAAAPAQAQARARAVKRKAPQKRLMQATYRPGFKNVKFIAIYDGGQAGGLKVKVGGSEFTTLTQPLVFTDRLAAAFRANSAVVLQNESSSPRSAIMLVGRDLPKEDRKFELVKVRAASARPPASKAGKGTNKRVAEKK